MKVLHQTPVSFTAPRMPTLPRARPLPLNLWTTAESGLLDSPQGVSSLPSLSPVGILLLHRHGWHWDLSGSWILNPLRVIRLLELQVLGNIKALVRTSIPLTGHIWICSYDPQIRPKTTQKELYSRLCVTLFATQYLTSKLSSKAVTQPRLFIQVGAGGVNGRDLLLPGQSSYIWFIQIIFRRL